MTDKYTNLYTSWQDLVKLKEDMGRKVLEIIAHPDAKAEDIGRGVAAYSSVVQSLRKHKPTILDALDKAPGFKNRVRWDAVSKQRI